jgi:hypothetical protein
MSDNKRAARSNIAEADFYRTQLAIIGHETNASLATQRRSCARIAINVAAICACPVFDNDIAARSTSLAAWQSALCAASLVSPKLRHLLAARSEVKTCGRHLSVPRFASARREGRRGGQRAL